jgi:hypothetical protein
MLRLDTNMDLDNSLVEFYSTLLKCLHREVANSYGVSHRIITLDHLTIDQRVKQEGISFLTKTLPAIGKALDSALSMKNPFNIPHFRKEKGTTIPHFMGWLFRRIFDANTGLPLDCESSPEPHDIDLRAIASARQILYIMYKLELPYAEKTSQKVIDAFVATEEDLLKLQIDPKDKCLLGARAFISRVLGDLDPYDIIPRHGPGAVSTGERGLKKADFSRLYRSLESEYPFTEYFCYSLAHVCDELQRIESLDVQEAGTAKVVLVPKDSRGPRLISCEPLELQWIQQGLMTKIVKRLESDPLTAGHVNFTDQSINRQLALESSVSGKWVTLDMKEASDRVSLELVNQLFCGTRILRGLTASRSRATQLPDGRLIEMKKFAPMGSAVCFPVESLIFYALSVSAISTYTTKSRAEARRLVYVYGDDLIVDAEVHSLILQHLPRFGLLFNDGKCCTEGFFRESCGCDAYKGFDVTPIKLRSVWRSSKMSPGDLASWVSYSNSLWRAGYWDTAQLIENKVNEVYPHVPYNNNIAECEILNRSWSELESISVKEKSIAYYRPNIRAIQENRCKTRWNKKLFRWEVLTPVIRPTKFHGKPKSGWREMLRRKSSPSLHKVPGTYTLPRRVKLHRGWTALVD